MGDNQIIFHTKTRTWECNNHVYIMGILNVTPDSFYDGNQYSQIDQAKKQVDKMIDQGADIIDIGGESTRPGADKITAKEELHRILPIIKYIKKKYSIVVSVDTYKSEVAHAVLQEGAEIINDISGLLFDKDMAKTIANADASVVLMHIKGTPKTMQKNPVYKDLISEIRNYLETSIKIGLDNGIQFNNIIIDPGIGFGKTLEQNYTIIKQLDEFHVLKRPILMGLSRKSLIGKVLENLSDQRLLGTVALNTLSIANGASFIRVHDVSEHYELKKILEFYINRS